MMLTELARKFRDQERFATDYAPLYARYFGTVAGWLEADDAAQDPLAQWLLQASAGRSPFSVTNTLAAGLHRDVLAQEPAALPLARFYPTAGGNIDAPGFADALRQVILARQETLAAFIQTANVQTNETGRGLAWLLPLRLTGWEAVHLVDLGASAGLNLLADRRHFRLVNAQSGAPLLDLGAGEPEQFRVQVEGSSSGWLHPGLNLPPLPRILSRLGGDMHPFHLRSRADELRLMSFVWADHVPRLQRLQEGIAARQAFGGDFRLESLEMPAQLPHFLATHITARHPHHPVVLYNTYMTTYLSDKGASLRQIIGDWAGDQPHPVLWLQWEPPPPPIEPPAFGWCAWTADYWQQQTHHHHQFGWVHPHGAHIIVESGEWQVGRSKG
ncbi:MAG: DUF2332 domain-containing protein [Anaerolineales bacterium]|nr:DUF2332 domain-containing protein [Anaerolineales bacterium]